MQAGNSFQVFLTKLTCCISVTDSFVLVTTSLTQSVKRVAKHKKRNNMDKIKNTDTRTNRWVHQ